MSEQRGGDGVVAVGEDVGFDAHLVADGALCGEASAVDLRGESFNDDALASIRIQSVSFMASPCVGHQG